MPVRDGGAYLAPAVASILEQSWRELELIVVDDGSTDGAVDALPSGNARLLVTACRGRGVADAFNTGWAMAKGEYIARMDADDIALPDRLAVQRQLLEGRPDVAIAGACVEIFSAAGVARGNRLYQDWLNSLREPADIRRELFIECPLPNPTAMFRRDALQQLGGYAQVDWAEDYDLFLRADALGLRMAKPDGVLLRWRDHPQRLTRTDPRNSRAAFQAAKAHHLLRGRISPEGILIWGAGPGGRRMHDLLEAEGASVAGFVDIHPRRVGGTKRGLPVWPIERAAGWSDGVVLVAVGTRSARPRIRAYLQERGREEGRHFLFVL